MARPKITQRERREFKARTALNLALAEVVACHMDWPNEKGRRWMAASNPNLGGATPAALVMNGRGHKVLSFIESAMEEAQN
jgi:hypothetical protein